MDNESLKILEQVFEAEIDGALSRGPRLYQTKSKVAKQLVESGHLAEETIILTGGIPIHVTGYVLTHLGRMEYCASV